MIKCIRYKPYVKGTLIGFADIFVIQWRLEMYGLTYHQNGGEKWINFPSKEYQKDGEKKHAAYYRLPDKSEYDFFCEKVKESIEARIQENILLGENNNEFDSAFCF